MTSWLSQLEQALTARGIAGPARSRITLELADHIACDPGCEERLGDPDGLAALFADELAATGARRSAWRTFWALAVAAVALVVSQLAIARTGGYPGFDHGLSVGLFAPAALGMFFGPQVALVAGCLAVLRVVRRRAAHLLPAAEIALIIRRCRVALGGGLATVAGLGLYVVNFCVRLPAWWVGLVAAMAALGAGALLAAGRGLSRTAVVVCEQPGAPGDVFDDLPIPGAAWLRRGRWRLGLIGSGLAGLAMTVFAAHAEHSVIEGLERGIPEGIAAAAGFALLAAPLLLRAREEAADVRPEPR